MSVNEINLLIVGAGCTGREVLQYAKDCISMGWKFTIKGFIDSDANALKGHNVDAKIIGDDDYVPEPGDVFVITLQEPATRERLANLFKSKGARLFSVIHPRAYVAPSASVGAGCIIAPFVFIAVNSFVGENSLINVGAVIGHDAKIGGHSTLCPGASASGMVVFEKKVFMGTNAVVTPGFKVGQCSKITAGSVVYKDVEDNSIAAGNPAKTRPLIV